MSQFRFQTQEWKISRPQDWVQVWADRYDRFNSDNDDREGYEYLIGHCESPPKEYFERMGQWKDGAYKQPSKWRENVASVAYLIWMEAANDPPQRPPEDQVEAFLAKWAEKSYTDRYPSRWVKKRFGLSRATTMLHFLAGGRYPIFDSRVRIALSRILGCPIPAANTLPKEYLEHYCPIVAELAAICDIQDDRRKLDKALFAYGAYTNDSFPKFALSTADQS